MGLFSPKPGRITGNMCRQLGWTIDEQEGIVSALNFGTPQNMRQVIVLDSNDVLVTFFCKINTVFSSRSLAGELLFATLRRSAQTKFGKWVLMERREGGYWLQIGYAALAAGLTPPLFRMICEELSVETARMEQFAEEEGFVR
ncbi:hypothetical protein [Zavarzinella formosa]|uniref:hypothetical protein n=1 Tax=Zavarzinella formosa TaxID=360055 RepID=UPI0002F9A064|nr:hypothetical protein [Zavarzinella formosa]